MYKLKTFLLAVGLLIGLLHTQDAKAIKITFGTKCHPDGAGACVGERGFCLIIEIRKVDPSARMLHPNTYLGDDMALGEMLLVSSDVVRLDILEQRSDVELNDHFVVEEDIPLNEIVCRELGVNNAVIRAGSYPVDYSALRYGSVLLNIFTQ
jgi:hypothetical protein